MNGTLRRNPLSMVGTYLVMKVTTHVIRPDPFGSGAVLRSIHQDTVLEDCLQVLKQPRERSARSDEIDGRAVSLLLSNLRSILFLRHLSWMETRAVCCMEESGGIKSPTLL